MAAAGLASLLAKSKSSPMEDSVEEEEEPMSKQLEILMERRRQEEVRKARHHWSLLRNSIHNTIAAVKQADVKNHVISHGLHHLRKLNHSTILKQVLFIRELQEYLTTDGQCVRFFLADGRKKKTYTPEEPVDHISYCAQYRQYVGWITGGDELFLMDKTFEILSQSRAPSKIMLAEYNVSTGEYITVGPGYFVTWAFRYGARHLIPRKMNRTEFKENRMFTHMVLESTASRSQKIFLSIANSIVVYNVFEGNVLSYKKNLHEREITAVTFFNPLKYLVTGALDGTIKVWDNQWHIQMVFVGHIGLINALDVYPHGSAVISASVDKTIRVWNLDTCDEVDRIDLEEPVESLQTILDYDVFLTYSGKTVNMWKTQHLYHIHTSVGQRVIKIKHTSHPNFSVRSVVLSRDSSVRIISPVTGEVITTLLLSPSRSIVDIAYAVEDETLFTVMNDGNIVKSRTDTNPCRVVKEWKIQDPKEACNYLLVYEYVVDIQLDTDKWNSVQRGVTTKSITSVVDGKEEDEDENGNSMTKRNVNRTLLLGGRKDGYICVYNWKTGKVEFKIDAHGSKGVMSMIANSKVDQLISAGLDNVIKVWRVYPFVEESLAPLMSFFCANLPLHMTMIKTHLCVGFQDHGTATYSIVMYNLRDRKLDIETEMNAFDPDNRFDHEPGDDHTDAITGITACARMKLYASSSLDGTIRIWDETNKPVRLLKLKSIPYSIGFCSPRGDLMVGIGKHMYKVPYYAYLPKAYMFRMVSMKFTEPKLDNPIPEDTTLIQKMSKSEISRLKNSHSSFKFSNYMDLLTEEELEEINREKLVKEEAFSILLKREDELSLIREGDLVSSKKPKSTNYTKNRAFKNYMKMYYDKPKPTVRKDDPYPMDTVQERIKEPEEPEEVEWQPEREPTGFFPPASESKKPEPDSLNDSPLKAAYPIRLNGFIPNSILMKLLWPQQARDRRAEKRQEWKLPSFSAEQLDQISRSKKAREAEEQVLDRWPTISSFRVGPRSRTGSQLSQSLKSRGKVEDEKQVSFMEDGEEDISGRIMDMDWGDEEEEARVESPVDIYDSPKDKKPKKVEEPPPKSALMNKFADIMTRSPTPPPQVELDLSKESSDKSMETMRTPPPSRPPSTPKKPVKPLVKHISKPPTPSTPTPPPKARTPVPSATRLATPVSSVRRKTPSPPPPPARPATPIPSYITQFQDVEWFQKVFPNFDENTFPKPWTMDNFVQSLLRMMKVAEFPYKTPLLEAILMLHEQYGFSDSTSHSVCKAVSGVLNDQKNPPMCIQEDQRNCIVTSLKVLFKMGTHDKEFIAELLVQFLDGDKEVRGTVQSILTSCGHQDPHRQLPRELDSWDIWNVEEADRKADLHKMCVQWLDRWMTSYKLHLEDAIERMKKGQNIHGRMSRDQYKRRTSKQADKSILRRSMGVGGAETIQEDGQTDTTVDDPLGKGITVTFDQLPDPSLIENATYIDAMNYFCDMMMEKEIEAMRTPGKKAPGSKENVVQAKNTVLVLPKIPHKPALVRLGETHTSTCRPHRETNLHVDYRLPPVTARGYPPIAGEINGFVNSINLPMKSLNLNPFPNILDELDARFQEPILITLKSSQKYFIPSQSCVPQEAIAAAL